MKLTKYAFLLVLSAMGLAVVSCTDDIADDAHYKPHKTSGNAYEAMKQAGNYTQFLRGVDLSGYKPIVDGKSIVTVMAPDDDAFATFLSQKGVGSVDELYQRDPEYLKRLITYHVMYYSFDWQKLVNFRPNEGDAASEADKAVNAGYYYKHRTYCSDPIEQRRVKLTPNATTDTLIHIYHYDRYLPVLSNKLFETKGINPSYNYTYFFPQSAWGTQASGEDGTFNVANAQVEADGNTITTNGYLYHINQVIEPLNTIYGELKQRGKYSEFLNLYDQYSTYTLADDQTITSLGYDAYIHTHGTLPMIAMEWPTTNSMSMNSLERVGYNLFVPSNTAIADFFESYWKPSCGYTSLATLDPLILQYFIYQSFSADNFIAFPEEIKNGTVLTTYGTPININPDQVSDRVMCENGALYGMDHLEAPAIFQSVVGPSFQDTTYINYLYALDGSSTMLTLASQKSQFVTLIPSNQQFANSDPQMRLYTTTSGKELQQYSSDAGDFAALGSSAMQNIVNIHTAPNMPALPESGTRVVQTNVAYNYWYVHDGKITTSALFNEQLSPTYQGTPFVGFHKLTNGDADWSNGSAYSYDAQQLFKQVSGDGLAHALSVANDKNYKYYLFAQLLKKAGLIDGTTLSNSILPTEDTRFFCFIPTNEAIAKHIKEMPGCRSLSVSSAGTLTGNVSGTNKANLANYLRSYFVTAAMNTFDAYPYVGSTCSGEFFTTGSYKMRVGDDGSKLSVSFVGADKNNTVGVDGTYFYLPFAFADGCFHLIDGILL